LPTHCMLTHLFGARGTDVLCMSSPTVSALHAPSRAASLRPRRWPGLIGWVPNCDTLHALIREYRDARKIPLNVEHRLMLGMAPDYDHLTVIQKVEVFEHALESTSGAPKERQKKQNKEGKRCQFHART